MAFWSEDRIEQVRSLAATGMSAAQIAAQVGGVTRNAVVGIGHRRGFQFLGNGGGANHIRTEKKRNPIKRLKPALPEEQPRDGMLTLMELRHDSCRFISGDVRDPSHRYCGQRQEEDRSFCPDHCRIVYAPLEDRNVRK